MSHRKSIEQHKRDGTYKPARHAAREREEAGIGLLKELPPPPFELSKDAAQVFREEGLRLIRMKMLKPSDLRTLAMYASETGLYIEEMRAAREEGVVVVLSNGVTAVSHHRRAAESALKNSAALADKLGLNPNARHRLKGEAAFQDDEEPEENDVLAGIIRMMNLPR